ncbi:ExeM/NucH family extracellular endonuclease [Rubrimonas cliftonensis]|uniref:Predicted extracellular nuclease n=1 Tax=Rubrimonas cliftonensis TaxID=89524 RepID=A0A1H3VLH2_9RHOB|nr:ExeM/NucH family extracellular endonuclease [Rubrimonas cliftonensis]SDZ75599.1 Predicted extracellular nuclease [Rubrimonas cliftonensis]
MAPLDISVNRIARFETGVFDGGGSEVVVHDGGRFYSTNADANAIDIYTVADGKIGSISLAGVPNGGGVTSVAVKDGLIAAAVANADKTQNGFVALFDAADTSAPAAVLEVGALPDMLTFTPGGQIVVALEGEPADDGTDPSGGVAVITPDASDLGASTVEIFDFTAFDGQEDALRAAGVRIREGAAASVDFEPEYITVDPQTGNLFVTLQENNAVAVFDMTAKAFTAIQALGTVDHSIEGQGIDPSDRDDIVEVRTVPVQGMRMPDAIAAFVVDGQSYYATANEGDGREYDFYEDETRVEDIDLDPSSFQGLGQLQSDNGIGRLTVSAVDGDFDGDGDFDQLFSFGSRSFTIFDADGNVVFDSGDDFEQIIARDFPNRFNVNNDEPFDVDTRSDAKGPEPEAIAIAHVDGHTLALIGLERVNGVMVYDVTDPVNAVFLTYIDTVVDGDGSNDTANLLLSDLGPETIAVVSSDESESGLTEIAVANEISGSISVYTLEFVAPAPTFDLQVTEMWPGNDPGNNLTSDWFEVTNFGDAAWTAADGALYFDDESADRNVADLMEGVASIAAGESAIFVEGDAGDVAEFLEVWAGVIDPDVKVGFYNGAGLGQGGDAVALFIDDENDGLDADDALLDFEAFPDANDDGGQSYEVEAGAFSVDGVNGAATTAAVNSASQPAVGSPGFEQSTIFTLQLLHVADQEASTQAVFDAPRLSAVMNALEAQDVGANATLRLSSGDAILPGLFFQASAAVFGQAGVADMIIQNELDWDAIAFGNHEFDFGSPFIADLIDGTFDVDLDSATAEEFLSYAFPGVPAYEGTLFPYLSANLDFSTEPSLAPLEVAGGGTPMARTVTSSVVLEEGGELIGVVGATTPTIDFISSPGLLGVLPEQFDGDPTAEQIDALAAIIQAEVDALLDANPSMNKVILLAHMQQIAIEQQLAARLENVDIIVAGGSNTRLFDENDRARDGDSVQGEYPIVVENAGGTDTLVVNTDGSYKYVGRLVIDFDAAGNIIAESYDSAVSGAYATDAQGVADLGAEGLIDPEIQAVADLIGAEIQSKESNVFGVSEVYLAGLRPEVRQEETNLGNLTADANLAEAKKTDATVLVSIKNGGGIRDDIGQIIVPPNSTEAVRTPNEEILDADGAVIKPAGGISQNDIGNALRFNNDLSLVTLTGAELRAVLEHGVAASTYDFNGGTNQQGRFPQVAGVSFSFDPELAPGARIVNAAVLNEDGSVAIELVRDRETVSPDASIRVVTLGFLASGGDGYPFPVGDAVDRVDLIEAGVQTGLATFADDGTEQDALAEYLAANFLETPYAIAETEIALDTRIQNLTFRADSVFDDVAESGAIYLTEIIEGSSNNKAVEIYNDTGVDIDLAAEGYSLQYYFNGNSSAGLTIALTGSVEDGRTYVVAQSSAAAEILAVADQTQGSGWFNGDDVITLVKDGVIIDSFGQIGVDPGTEWPGGGQDDTLRRKEGVTEGDPEAFDAFDASVEWDVFPNNTFDDLGAYGRDAGDDGDGDGDGDAELTLISAIQGSGDASPLAGQRVTVQAVVTVVSNQLNGFFLQEEAADSDGDAATSEGIFVFTGSDPTVSVGDLLEFDANVSEFFTLTQLSGLGPITVIAEGADLPPAVEFTLPLPDATDPAAFYESLEGMLVRATAAEGETLRVSDAFTNFGEVGVTAGDPLVQPTQAFESFSPEAEALAAANERNLLVFENPVDDSLTSAPRVGDGIVGGAIEGAMNFTFGEYKVETSAPVEFDASVNPNPRQDAPDDVGGRLKVASFNVLNYFTTLVSENGAARGAETAAELTAQTAKIVAAITAIDADILGLIEIENDLSGVPDEAVSALVDAINAALGAEVYDFIATGKVGGDAIKQAIIFKTETVAPKGDFAVLEDEAFTAPFTPGSPQSRPAVAQSFEEVGTGEVFTVSVNHFKSKGSTTGAVVDGEADDNPVEGSAALTRIAAAQELAAWLATDPTGSGDADHLTIGDFNAYAMERAIKALEAEGFTNLAAEDAISYYFNGEGGTLDYAFANDSLLDQVTGSTIWNINSVEAYSIQYNESDFAEFGDLGPFASSDHDPVIIGLNLQSVAEPIIIVGETGSDRIVGSEADEIIRLGAGRSETAEGGGGEDVFQFFAEDFANGQREVKRLTVDADDLIDLGGAEITGARDAGGDRLILTIAGDGDTLIVSGLEDDGQIVNFTSSVFGDLLVA